MIHSRISTSTSAGATIGTFDPVTTRNTNNGLPSGCTQLVGLTYSAARVALTAAKSKQTRLRVTHPASGLNNDDFLVGHLDGTGIATNDQAGGINVAEFIPILREGKLGLSSVNFAVSDAGQAATDASSLVCSPVSYTPQSNLDVSRGIPPKEWYEGRISWPGWSLPVQGSVSSNGAATATAANGNTDLTSATIRAEYDYVIACRLSMAAQTVGAAGEEAVGWGAFDNSISTLSNMSPQEWPFNAIMPTLGTPVGTPTSGHVYPLPMYIATPDNDVVIDVFHNLNVAVTTALSAAWGVFVRK